MDDGQEQDQYEERLKEVFNSFDTSGSGSLCLEELSELCQSLHLDDATPALLQTLLQNQDRHTARVNFDQFKNALILVLSSAIEPQHVEEETLSKPGKIQPKFVKGSKRYGRRSTPEFTETISDFSEVRNANPVDQQQEEEEEEEEDREDNYDSAPSTPRRSSVPLSSCLEERLREACGELLMTWDGCADHTELLALCKHLGLELNVDLLDSLNGDGVMNVEEFISRVLNHNKPPTPSASTPYRQLKRHRSTQPFDEGGRRIAAPSVLTSTIGMRLFSTLDDGTGFTPVECILDAWLDEGIENSTEILQALNFNLDGKLSLSDLTTALENELLVAKNGIHQAAVASFKAEIRYLLERVDREVREKEKIQSDLEKTEKLKNQLATEVDEHHSAIEHKNNLNLRKLEQDHKEKLAAMRSELMQEVDQLQQQASLQREELEAEVQKVREDESFLRDHLSISVKENRRLEMELLDSTEKLVEAKNQIAKLQTCVDNIMKERFGDLDPGSADFLLQEERIKQLRIGYEAQYRRLTHEDQKATLALQYQQEVHALREEMAGVQSHAQELQSQLEQAELECTRLDQTQAKEREELENLQEEEVAVLRQQLLEAHTYTADLEEQLSTLEAQLAERDETLATQMEELREQHGADIKKLEEERDVLTEARLEEERRKLQEEKAELEKRLLDERKREKEVLQESHEKDLKAKLEEEKVRFEGERDEIVQRLTEQWKEERAQLDEENNESLQVLLEEEMFKLIREQEEKESKLSKQWEKEREIEISFTQRITEVEDRFSADQESVEKRFQADVLKLEQHYQSELKALTESHMEHKLHWEAQIQEALKDVEEQRRAMEETMEREREQQDQQRKKELHELENLHEEKLEELMTRNQQLQTELDDLISKTQTKEIELSRQLNDLHSRLQESLETRDELLAQTERKALETELLLNQTVEDFKWERAELLISQTELEEKIKQMQYISERQISERIELLTERDDLKVKIEELEMLLQQAAVDFELEQKELKEHVSILEKARRDDLGSDKVELIAEREMLKNRIKDQQLEDQNRMLSEKDAQNIADMENLRQQLVELMEDNERKELAACVSDLEKELTKALKETTQLKQKNAQLSQQLSGLREKPHESRTLAQRSTLPLSSNEKGQKKKKKKKKKKKEFHLGAPEMFLNCYFITAVVVLLLGGPSGTRGDCCLLSLSTKCAVSHQSARRKSDLHDVQQERDSLKHNVTVLNKQLHDVNDKNRVLEKALHSTGLTSQNKRQYRDGVSRLMEKDQQLLQQEKERLQAEVCSVKEDLVQSREKVMEFKKNSHFQFHFLCLLLNYKHLIFFFLSAGPVPAFSLQGPVPEQRAAHADSYRRIGGL
uniref:EF-hand domain-containing protein n=1 Tax=Mola mola TaxID=94237 RepID=A0A3Q3WEL7_MOLML